MCKNQQETGGGGNSRGRDREAGEGRGRRQRGEGGEQEGKISEPRQSPSRHSKHGYPTSSARKQA